MILILLGALAFADLPAEVKRPGACAECVAIRRVLESHANEASPDKRLRLTLQVSKIIKAMRLKSQPPLEQKRRVFFAIDATVQMLPDDFDSANVAYLMDLRAQTPSAFDEVFWRLPLGAQKSLIERMDALKADRVRPNAVLPVAKALD